ncbi:hypothetical protein PENANT_c021G05203 [Penicillium antarcticum]|uniref:Uncharacterized protein n=1 Tax=Penicillium antarcticum TaxID=416450 RepID=A0A1V6PZS9_9EURO|nr:hypothetical protein PENANT_c021G05203 [Penicillium antarcticum]
MRLICHKFALDLERFLFANIEIHFRSNTTIRSSRMAALERIGRNIRAMTFKIPHGRDTFLLPILDPITGTERIFVYIPNSSNSATYGNREMADLLVKQYPIYESLARAKSPAIATAEYIPERLYTSDQIQDLAHHQHIEQVLGPDTRIDNPYNKFAHKPDRMTDHLKLLHAYLGSFHTLQRLVFRWEGKRGLLPLKLATEPSFNGAVKAEPSPGCSRRPEKPFRQLKFKHLQQMELANATMDASQIATFIQEHRGSLREFNFGNVVLRSGTWDDALAPLDRLRAEKYRSRDKTKSSSMCR